HRIAGLEAALLDLADVHEEIAELLLCVGNAEQRALGALDHALVPDLAAALAIERRLVEDQRALVASLQRLDRLAVAHKRADLALGRLCIVAEELGGADLFLDLEPDLLGGRLARALPGAAGLLLLLRHGGVEGF